MLGAASSGCVSKAPRPPALDIYIHDSANSVAYGKNSEGAVLEPISIKETDNWFMFSPRSWESVQNYVDLLVCIIDGGCKSESKATQMTREEALERWLFLKKTMNEMRGAP
jgi:hypothetical protein